MPALTLTTEGQPARACAFRDHSEETERLLRRAADAIADAREDDPGFAAALTELVNRLERREADQASRAAGGGGTGAGQMGGRDALAQHAETGGVNITGGVALPPAVILRSSDHRSQDHAGCVLAVWGRRTAQPYQRVRLCRERLGWSAGQEGALVTVQANLASRPPGSELARTTTGPGVVWSVGLAGSRPGPRRSG